MKIYELFPKKQPEDSDLGSDGRATAGLMPPPTEQGEILDIGVQRGKRVVKVEILKELALSEAALLSPRHFYTG